MQSNFKFDLAATGPGLTFRVLIDDNEVWHGQPDVLPQTVTIEFDDTDAQHRMVFEMSGKTLDHTRVDENNNITADTLLNITDMRFDDINLDQVIYEKAQYQHDFNGHGPKTTEKFFGHMGCNGCVTLEFSTPIYLWILENM